MPANLAYDYGRFLAGGGGQSRELSRPRVASNAYGLGRWLASGGPVPPLQNILPPLQRGFESSALAAGRVGGNFLAGVRGLTPNTPAITSDVSPARSIAAPNAIPVNFTPSATRAQSLSQKSLAALNPGRYNVSVGGSTYRNVSPEFARSAGLTGGRSDTLTEVPKATQILSPATPLSDEGQRLLAQANQVNSARAAIPPTTTVGLTDNEKMTRYGTRFPDELPLNPTFRDVRNLQDYDIRSRIPRTSNPSVGAGSSAMSGVY
jgi:hypothetical protein